MEYSLRDLLVIEDDLEFLAFRCPETGILAWPYTRLVFIRMMMSDLLYQSPMPIGRPVPPLRAAMTLTRSLAHNAALRLSGRSSANICMMSSGARVTMSDGKWFNRLSDHFAGLRMNETIVVENQFEWQWPFPRFAHRVLLDAPNRVRNAILGRLQVRSTHVRLARQVIGLAADRAKRHLNWTIGPQREALLITMLARRLAAMPHEYAAYSSLLQRIGPRLLIKESACYGPHASLIAAARAQDIVVAENQHGTISVGHGAYNLAPTLAASPEYRACLPDHLLSFGSYWTDQINVPVNPVAIGSPERDENLRRIDTTTTKDTILVLGDGIETELYLNLARSLKARLMGKRFRVMFRPHPLERSRIRTMSQAGQVDVELDPHDGIYAAFAEAYAVISEVSTGLFEAIGLADRIFVWDTPKSRFAFASHPFGSFATGDELAEFLIEGKAGIVDTTSSRRVWAPDWRANYNRFVDETLRR